MNGKQLACALALVAVFPVLRAGELTPPAPSSNPASARFTLGDIWSRLSAGAAGTKRSGAFVEPPAGPGTATMKTTDQIMAAAPALDNTNGATAADVLAGRTFWGLRTSGGVWGLQTGTGTGGSYAAGVPKTWQKKCWAADGTEIVGCTGTAADGTPAAGQDGNLQKGVAYPNPRFTKNGNGTVTDNMTGLIWLEDANCSTVSPKVWKDAIIAVNALASGVCGLTDGSTAGQWRLPNVREPQSLIDYNYGSPAVPNTLGTGQWTAGNPFTNVHSRWYWTSSTNASSTALAWLVVLGDGSVINGGSKVSGRHDVWPVRGGP